MPEISKLILTAQENWILSASVLGALIFLIFTIGYLRSQSEKTMTSKIIDIVLFIIYTACFFGAVLGGLYLGKQYGNMAAGFCAGVFLFWLIFRIFAFIKKKRMKV